MKTKKCKVVALPFKNSNDLDQFNQKIVKSDLGNWSILKGTNNHWRSHHLYLVIDKSPDVGEYTIINNEILKIDSKVTEDVNIKYIFSNLSGRQFKNWFDAGELKTIVATSSIKYGIAKEIQLNLPTISDGFVEKWVKSNGSISDVLVEMNEYVRLESSTKYEKDVIVCNGEVITYIDQYDLYEFPEEVKVNSKGNVIIHPIKLTYSKDEVIELLNEFSEVYSLHVLKTGSTFDKSKWMEEHNLI